MSLRQRSRKFRAAVQSPPEVSSGSLELAGRGPQLVPGLAGGPSEPVDGERGQIGVSEFVRETVRRVVQLAHHDQRAVAHLAGSAVDDCPDFTQQRRKLLPQPMKRRIAPVSAYPVHFPTDLLQRTGLTDSGVIEVVCGHLGAQDRDRGVYFHIGAGSGHVRLSGEIGDPHPQCFRHRTQERRRGWCAALFDRPDQADGDIGPFGEFLLS